MEDTGVLVLLSESPPLQPANRKKPVIAIALEMEVFMKFIVIDLFVVKNYLWTCLITYQFND